MDFKIDWLTLTVKPEKNDCTYLDELSLDMDDLVLNMCPLAKWIFDFLKLIKLKPDFRFKCGSVQHYNYMYSYNGIDIAFANPEHFAQQGLMIRFSAQGVAFYEKYRKTYESEWTWISFLKEFFALGFYGLKCKCTRIDLAYDDISYDDNHLISLKRILKAVNNEEIVSLFKNRGEVDGDSNKIEFSRRVNYKAKKGIIGETIGFGNRKSTVYLRFYDKLKEQLNANQEIDENIKHWVRMEFEFKRSRAMAICDSLILLSMEDFGTYFSQVVNRYIRFIKPEGTREHYNRCKSRKWWVDLVGTVEKARLVENKAVKNRYKSSMRWLKRNVFPTLYAVLCCMSIDKFLTNVREEAVDKLSYKHEDIIRDYISHKEEENHTGIENHKESTDDFDLLVKELEKTALTNTAKASGKQLCEILSLQAEFDAFYRPRTDGMINKDITEFMNRQMCVYYDLKEIEQTFELLGVF